MHRSIWGKMEVVGGGYSEKVKHAMFVKLSFIWIKLEVGGKQV